MTSPWKTLAESTLGSKRFDAKDPVTRVPHTPTYEERLPYCILAHVDIRLMSRIQRTLPNDER